MTAAIHGRLGALDLAATTLTGAYVVPALRKATVCVSLCNRTSSSITVRLALIAGAVGSVALSDYLEFGAVIAPGGVLERTGITMAAAQTLAAYALATGISVVVWGIEEDA